MESFDRLATPPNFLSTDVNTLMGFHLDGEVIFDANLKPLHISEYETFASRTSTLVQTKSYKPVPENANRLMLYFSYNWCIINSFIPIFHNYAANSGRAVRFSWCSF